MRFRRARGASVLPGMRLRRTRGRAPAAAFGIAPPFSGAERACRAAMRVGGSSARMRATLAASNLRGKGGGSGVRGCCAKASSSAGRRNRWVSAGNHQGCHQQSRSALRGAVCDGHALGIFAPGPESVVQAEELRFDGMRESANCGTVPSI